MDDARNRGIENENIHKGNLCNGNHAGYSRTWTEGTGVIKKTNPPKNHTLEKVTAKIRAAQKGQTPKVIITESAKEAETLER